MLASLLPGLRDLRAPLAAGYLWLAAGWLYFAPQLPASVNDADGVLKDIYRVADASNPVAIAAGLTFIAYLLGILSTGLLTPVVPVIWTLLILPIVLSGIAVDSIERRIKKRRQVIHLTEFADDDLWASLTRRRRWTTRADRKIDLLAERASTAILIDPNHRNTFLEKLEERSIRRLIRRMDGFGIYSYQNLMENASEDEEGKLVKLRKMLAEDLQEGSKGFPHDKLDVPGSVRPGEWYSTWPHSQAGTPKAAAVALFASEVNVYEHLREIDEELELVPERIVGDKPATYERWDRLMAEAEFRQAIVPPLFAIVAALMARGVLGWPLWLLAAIIPFVIYYQGVRKENAAEAQLIQTVEANVVQLTTLERLSTADLHWRY